MDHGGALQVPGQPSIRLWGGPSFGVSNAGPAGRSELVQEPLPLLTLTHTQLSHVPICKHAWTQTVGLHFSREREPHPGSAALPACLSACLSLQAEAMSICFSEINHSNPCVSSLLFNSSFAVVPNPLNVETPARNTQQEMFPLFSLLPTGSWDQPSWVTLPTVGQRAHWRDSRLLVSPSAGFPQGCMLLSTPGNSQGGLHPHEHAWLTWEQVTGLYCNQTHTPAALKCWVQEPPG